MTQKNKNHGLKGLFCMPLLSLDLSSYRILNFGFFRSWKSGDIGEKIKVQTFSGSQTRPSAFMGVGGRAEPVRFLS